jgi:molecular chaperone GrpE
MKTQDFNENNPIEQTEQPTGVDINTDENIAGTQNLNEPVAEEGEIEKLKTQIDELNDKYLRHVAEFENFKRRNAKERMELIQTAGKDVIVDLLDVLDDSERAQKSMEEATDLAQIKEGVQLVFNKLRSSLQSKGLKPMETKGVAFNADLHEAITEIEAGPDMQGKIVDEVKKGYYLNDKIIRYAKVVVGR